MAVSRLDFGAQRERRGAIEAPRRHFRDMQMWTGTAYLAIIAGRGKPTALAEVVELVDTQR